MGGTSMKDVGGAGFAGSSLPFLGRERAAVYVDVGPERIERVSRYGDTSVVLVLDLVSTWRYSTCCGQRTSR